MTCRMMAPIGLALMMLSSSSIAGPFGLKMGTPLSSLVKNFSAKERATYVYQLNSVPQPHARFATYMAIATPAHGLCKLIAISPPIKTSGHGSGLKSEFDAIDGVLLKKYGERKRFDHLLQGSLWKEPQYWMMGLFKKERTLSAFWSTDKAAFVDQISAVALEAAAISAEAGTLTLSYEFENFSDCSATIKNAENSSL